MIENTGTISAEGGEILVTASAAKSAVENVINMDGIVSASSATVKGGKIILGGKNTTVKVKGKVEANGTDGGEITIDAENTVTLAGSEISASAIDHDSDGNNDAQAGRIVMWGRENAIYAGKVNAYGQNGFVETSGGNLGVYGDVNISAGSEWLLDPTNITIVSGASDATPALDNITFTADDSANDSIFLVSDATINAALNNDANVTLETSVNGTELGNILLRNDASILKTSAGASTFTLRAHRNVTVEGSIMAAGAGALNVVLNSDIDANQTGGVYVNNTNISTKGGSLTAGGGADPATTAAYGTSSNLTGIEVLNSTITSAGGNILMTGHGANTTGNRGVGVEIENSQLNAGTGTVTLNGTGGTGDDYNTGIYVLSDSKVLSDTAINMTGVAGGGSNSNSDYNYGVAIFTGSQIGESGSNAAINITGTGGNGDDLNVGVYLISTNTKILSNNTINITGTGGSDGTDASDSNLGIYVRDGAQVGESGSTAAITLTGTGGQGEDYNFGMRIGEGAGVKILSENSITLTGTGGTNGDSDSDYNYGVYTDSGAEIGETGSNAVITLTGTGAAADDNNRGIYFDINTKILSNNAINVTGIGGSNGSGGSNEADGIYARNDAQIGYEGSNAAITITGTAGAGEDANDGIQFDSGKVLSNNSITMTGTGASNGTSGSTSNTGIFLDNAATEIGSNASTATVSLTGTAGAGDVSNHGIFISDGAKVLSNTAINVTGTGASRAGGTSPTQNGILMVRGGTIGDAASAANITVTATGVNDFGLDLSASSIRTGTGNMSLAMSDANITTDSTISAGAGDVTIGRATAGTIGLGSAAGDLSLTQAELNRISGNNLNVGDAANTTALSATAITTSANFTGTTTLASSGDVALDGVNAMKALTVNSGGSIDVLGGSITTENGDVTLTAGTNPTAHDITIEGDITTGGGAFAATAGDDIQIRSTVNTGGGTATLTTLADASVSEVSITTTGKLETSGGNVQINSDEYFINATSGTKIDAGTGDVTIVRVSAGDMNLGAAEPSATKNLTQGALAAISGANLILGGALTQDINVEGVDTSAGITGLTTLAASGADGDVTFAGANTFNTLKTTAADDIVLNAGSSVTTNTGGVEMIASNSSGGGDAVMQVEGTIDTTAAGAAGAVSLSAAGYTVEVGPTGKILTNGGKLTATSDVGVDINQGAEVKLGTGDAALEAPVVNLGDDIETTGTISGIATTTTVNVQSDQAQIQDGVDVAANGATITVAAGTFAENVNVNKSVVLNGAQQGVDARNRAAGAETIIQATTTGLNVTAQDVTIDGVEVKNGTTGIQVATTATNAKILNTKVNGQTAGNGKGIVLQDVANADLNQNWVSNVGDDGISVLGTTTLAGPLENQLVEDAGGNGIFVTAAGVTTIQNNTVNRSGEAGIFTDRVAGATVTGNTTDAGQDGIRVRRGNNSLVTGNTVNNATRYGLYVQRTDDAIVSGNTLDGNRHGIQNNRSDRTAITGNTITNTTRDGIRVTNNSENVTIGGATLAERNTINGARDAVFANNASNLTVENNLVTNARRTGVSTTGSNNLTVKANDIQNSAAATEIQVETSNITMQRLPKISQAATITVLSLTL
jgi:parallel beta-helix repeat protein